jgi:hypothetical protein
MALVVLWPSWQLWKRMERSKSSNRPSKLYYLPLGLAALATAATSCPPIPNITRMVVENNTIYARSTWEGYFTSMNGMDWQYIWEDELSPSILNELQQEVSLPLTLCLPEDQNICYRITGEQQVEESLDGGYSWEVAWQIPFGRRSFMERKADGGLLGVCGKKLAPGPYDMVLIGGNGSRVLFASGNEGVLIRNEDGTFSRHGVLGAEPTPYADLNPTLVLGEVFLVLMLSIFVVLISSYMGWKLLLSKVKLDYGRTDIRKWVLWLAYGANIAIPTIGNLLMDYEFGISYVFVFPTLITLTIISVWHLTLRRCIERGDVSMINNCLNVFLVVAILMGIAPFYSFIRFDRTGSITLWISYPNIIILLVSMISLTWAYFKSTLDLPAVRSMQKKTWDAGILYLPLGWFPFLLWTIGWISWYELAVAAAGFSVIVLLIWTKHRLKATI